MLFNSIDYFIFLPLVFLLYWFVFQKSLKYQNLLMLVASYFFYAWWDWRFLFLLAFSTFLCYYTGLKIDLSENNRRRKTWLYLSVFLNLGFLGIFKYFNFFVESFADLLRIIGFQPHITTLRIILPVGISFYTFHGLSYVFDIYNKKIAPTRNVVDYSLFVGFFPLLVAGPIERATHLLPQIKEKRVFNAALATDGVRQILWGLFKKMVIADNCSGIVNILFADPVHQPGSALALGAVLFAFQIYGDFSGYSDIAIGTARLFGFDLLRNFSYPYFSRDIAEFWRRWHMSLTTWFRDYLYIPLGGSRGTKWQTIRNTFIIFLVSGFWHGANWTFIAWGGLHAVFFLPLLIAGKNRKNLNIVSEKKILPSFREFYQMLITFALATFAWIFFRADSISDALVYIRHIFSKSLFSVPSGFGLIDVYPYLFVMIIVEWLQRSRKHGLQDLPFNRVFRWMIYIVICILCFANLQEEQAFIYFQF